MTADIAVFAEHKALHDLLLKGLKFKSNVHSAKTQHCNSSSKITSTHSLRELARILDGLHPTAYAAWKNNCVEEQHHVQIVFTPLTH